MNDMESRVIFPLPYAITIINYRHHYRCNLSLYLHSIEWIANKHTNRSCIDTRVE